VALLAAGLAASPVHAQTLDRSLIGNGGGVASGTGQVVVGTLGQPVVGQAVGADRVVCHGWWCVELGSLVAVGDTPPVSLPTRLEAPRPNPTSGTVLLVFQLARPARVRVAIFDVAGTRVATPLDGMLSSGSHEARWDGIGRRGERPPAGVYFVSFTVDGRAAGRHRIVLVR
jgi:hypothetical protein